MAITSHHTLTTWEEFRENWDGVVNFMMAKECIPFAFDLPPIDRIVEEVRLDPQSNITPGTKGDIRLYNDTKEEFLKLPIDTAMKSSFGMVHYRLSEFDAPGKFLHGFKTKVLDAWQDVMRAQGFTWTRCYPIIFISGPGCATNYHMDFSNVVAWQRYGTKKFFGLKDPARWEAKNARVAYKAEAITKPAQIKPEDTLCYEMHPGDVLWNCLLTPHWVEASDEVAMSFNISHGGLRLHGKLCPFEQELEDYRKANPETAPAPVKGVY